MPDHDVMDRAVSERRIIITFDRDFGELIFARGVEQHPGVMLFRLVPTSPTEPAGLIRDILRLGLGLAGQFTVVERDKIRQRPIPGGLP
jgi:predicted nuclease of predicted toxin-antitoxin system